VRRRLRHVALALFPPELQKISYWGTPNQKFDPFYKDLQDRSLNNEFWSDVFEEDNTYASGSMRHNREKMQKKLNERTSILFISAPKQARFS